MRQNPEMSVMLERIRRNPRDLAAHINLGVHFSQSGDKATAISHFKKALALEKTNSLVLQKLIDLCISDRKPRDAQKYARKLMELDRKNPDALKRVAEVYEATGDITKAHFHIEQALKLDCERSEFLAYKAKLLSASGNLEEAKTIYEKLAQKGDPSAYWPLAQQEKFTADRAEAFLSNVENSFSNAKNLGDERALGYAKGKVLQDIGRYDAAFDAFKSANTKHDRQIMADRIIAAFINVQETYSQRLFEEKAGFGDSAHQPIFILGQTRSGTTLTESLMGAHSKVSTGDELHYFADYNNSLSLISTNEREHASKVSKLGRKEITGFAADYIRNTATLRKGTNLLTDKLPHNFLNIGLIALVFPNAKIIHCRRHPLDNCLSIFSNPMLDYHKEYKSNLETLGTYYRVYAQMMEFWKVVCPINIHEVYYEDLVTNTEAVARGMIDYLGLDWEDGVLDREGSQRSVKTLSVWQVRQPVFQTSKGKWRNYEKHLGPLRETIGDYVESYEKELSMLDNDEGRR